MLKPSFPSYKLSLPRLKNKYLAIVAVVAGSLSLFFFTLFILDADLSFLRGNTPADTVTLKAEPILRTNDFVASLFSQEELIKTARGDYIEADVRAETNPYEEDGFVYLTALHRNIPGQRLLLKFQKDAAQTEYEGVYHIRGRIHRWVPDGQGNLLALTVDRITESDYSAFLTADKAVVMDRTVKSLGYSITLKKAEFTYEESRLYLRIENNTGKPITFFKAYARLSYYSTFYGPLKNPNPDYPALPDTLAPGEVAEGILVMKKINLKYPWIKLVLDGEIQGIEGEMLQNSSFIFRIPLG